jgi:hypothetical protein
LDGGTHFNASGNKQGELVVLWGNRRLAVVKKRMRSKCWGWSRNELIKEVWNLRVEVAAFAGGEGVLSAARTAARTYLIPGRG